MKKNKIPPIPQNHIAIKFAGFEGKKRVYLADTDMDAVRFLSSLRVFGTFKPYNGGTHWSVEL